MQDDDDDPVGSQLIGRIRGKDAQALVDFIELRRPQLQAFIERNLGTVLARKVEAVDILQEVSLSAVASLPEVDLGERDPFNWLCQLAERRIIDAHRKHVAAQKRSAQRELPAGAGKDSGGGGFIDMLVVSMTSPSGAFSRDQREFRLMEALESLPEDARTALRLRYVEGLPSREIANRLGRTDGATRVLLTRSLARLQDLLRHESEFKSFLVAQNQNPPKSDAQNAPTPIPDAPAPEA
jgi:RNA polymerase sigma-70 factor (ECF subfamily)